MTNEYATKVLKRIQYGTTYPVYEALDMAIKALSCSESPNMSDTIYRQDAIDAICKACSIDEDYHKCNGYPETSTWCDELVALRALPSAQPDNRLAKIADLVEGTIDHFDLDDAMDLLYQIKEVLK